MNDGKSFLSETIYRLFDAREDVCVSEADALRPDLVGLRLFERPTLRFGAADDPLFESLKREGVVGPWHLSPSEWLPGARSVVSIFFPYTEAVRASVKPTIDVSPEWLHGRIEGQAMIEALGADIMRELGEHTDVRAVVPQLDERYDVMRAGRGIAEYENGDPETYGANWSERHVAYVCGHGTFGLSKCLITERGTSGRFLSVITDVDVEPDVRAYSGVYDYCTKCGACAARCPAGAISIERGKSHVLCSARLDGTRRRYAPRYGCGCCQTSVPCSVGVPSR